ncbi:MAG: hypothetical protein A3A44_01430 [Candidatus Sungbacteria bacterium RIFCSPLOWO2_01_FULL_60_25]|uniref:SIS domain-containing protein n=1 Tax=Candidatus Sungbacteria bacterium RIFCSPLOWO2_01_FULL_60_25 TaxID=1802281 RepID=A0A1G2LF50_9BACT|nr:MAG: hypothetical protein A3A44_01430 [Candidatus Sungbacteria bacterium RIFCSPLOWO2_01_FULL_60_25]
MNDRELIERIETHLRESARVKHALIGGNPNSPVGTVVAASSPAGSRSELPSILRASRTIADSFRSGGKLLLCGNGGSAADCQHLAAEFTNVLTKDFDRPGLPAIALTTDTSFLTSYVNDSRQFGEIFARQVDAIGRKGDVLMGLSTSGSSANVIRAVEAAKAKGLATIALTGERGALAAIADIAIRVPSSSTQHIQEAHLAIEHAIADAVERLLYPERQGPMLASVEV